MNFDLWPIPEKQRGHWPDPTAPDPDLKIPLLFWIRSAGFSVIRLLQQPEHCTPSWTAVQSRLNNGPACSCRSTLVKPFAEHSCDFLGSLVSISMVTGDLLAAVSNYLPVSVGSLATMSSTNTKSTQSRRLQLSVWPNAHSPLWRDDVSVSACLPLQPEAPTLQSGHVIKRHNACLQGAALMLIRFRLNWHAPMKVSLCLIRKIGGAGEWRFSL